MAAANSGNNFHLYDIGAIHGAATRLREKILKLSAFNLKVDPSELTIEDSVVKVPGAAAKQITFAELGRIAYNNQHLIPDDMEPGLESTFYYMFPHAKPNIIPDADRLVRAQFTFSAGAHAAVVEVDKATGKVEVLRYLIVGDNGTVINPDVVNGQVYGSAAHGIAVALGEGFMYSAEGQPLDDYLSRLRQVLDSGNPAGRSHSPPLPFAVHLFGAKSRRRRRRDPLTRRHRQRRGRRAQTVRRKGLRPATYSRSRCGAWLNHNPETERRSF